MRGVCRVCELIDEKLRIKHVTYCESCNAWICAKCKPDLLRRAKAVLIDRFRGMD